MTIREEQELREHKNLSPYASFSDESLGRDREEAQCDMRTVYQRDRDRILHCKSFRRLKHKTQVFLAPEGDHYRTRLTHTLEVAQIARSIARALLLNEDLTEAIALGHDLGHTPFGHAGSSRGPKAVSVPRNRGLEVVIIRPESMDDASEITDTLLSGKAIILNLEGINIEVKQRIIDYSAGSCYAIRGNLQKITNYMFVVTPPNVDVSGDIPELIADNINLNTFNNND